MYESARGCWWGARSHCTFCGVNGTSMAFRCKSASRVVEELTELARRYRRLDFEIVDNIIALEYFRDVLPRLKEAGYDLRLFYETKANLKREQVRLLRESGVNRIQPGLESLSTPILKGMAKGVTAFQNVRLLKWCAEYGVSVAWNVIYGFPGESPDEYARMAELVPSLVHLQPPKLGRPVVLHRFSPYHERPAHYGLEIVGPRRWHPYVYAADAATLTDLAYSFEYRHVDGRKPETYVAHFGRAIETWRARWPAAYRTLRYRRGPGFLVVHDRRPGLPTADYAFGEHEADSTWRARTARPRPRRWPVSARRGARPRRGRRRGISRRAGRPPPGVRGRRPLSGTRVAARSARSALSRRPPASSAPGSPDYGARRCRGSRPPRDRHPSCSRSPIGAHPQHVAGVQREILAHPADELAHAENGRLHGILTHLAVEADGDAQVVGIEVRHNPWTHRLKRISILATPERSVVALPGALADVVADGVAEHVVERLGLRTRCSSRRQRAVSDWRGA